MKLEPGIKNGRLTLVRIVGYRDFPSSKKQRIWECKCDCGKTAHITNGNFGTTFSCGCLRGDSLVRHGHYRHKKPSRIRRIWGNMLMRCSDPNSPSYERYGARGIRVHWRSFEEFLADMGPTYQDGLTIERKDNNGHYCRQNCRWATYKEQMLNTRRNVWLEHNGQRKTISQWADGLGMAWMTLKKRLNLGWTVSDALTTPIRK